MRKKGKGAAKPMTGVRESDYLEFRESFDVMVFVSDGTLYGLVVMAYL